nr:MAG TPA: hypothetical protein [Caudoviricetes sp.]
MGYRGIYSLMVDKIINLLAATIFTITMAVAVISLVIFITK